MATYLNAYELTKQIRMGLNEYDVIDENYLQGVDESGAYQNDYLLQQINNSQRYIYNSIMKKERGIFLKETSLTGVDSVFTLPWDFGYVGEFRDDNGYKVYNTKPVSFRPTDATGNKSCYYRKGNTFVVDKSSISLTYKLYYYSKPRDLDMGTCASGSATEIKLATSAKKLADYYNGMIIENITSDWVDTISDYTASRVATITETAAQGETYGIVSELPEPFHFLIPIRTLMEIKASNPVVYDTPSKEEIMFFNEQFNEALNSYAGSQEDESIEDMFTDFEPATFNVYYNN